MYGGVAQAVEHLPFKQVVGSSNLPTLSKFNRGACPNGQAEKKPFEPDLGNASVGKTDLSLFYAVTGPGNGYFFQGKWNKKGNDR